MTGKFPFCTLGEKKMIINLRAIRKARNLTGQEIADRLDISKTSYYKYERQERDVPTDLLVPLADVLDVSVDYLLRGDNDDIDEFIEDFVAYARRHFNQRTLHIIRYLAKGWDGDFESLIQMSGAYAALSPAIRKDISRLTLFSFEQSATDENLVPYIDVENYLEQWNKLDKRK